MSEKGELRSASLPQARFCEGVLKDLDTQFNAAGMRNFRRGNGHP